MSQLSPLEDATSNNIMSHSVTLSMSPPPELLASTTDPFNEGAGDFPDDMGVAPQAEAEDGLEDEETNDVSMGEEEVVEEEEAEEELEENSEESVQHVPLKSPKESQVVPHDDTMDSLVNVGDNIQELNGFQNHHAVDYQEEEEQEHKEEEEEEQKEEEEEDAQFNREDSPTDVKDYTDEAIQHVDEDKTAADDHNDNVAEDEDGDAQDAIVPNASILSEGLADNPEDDYRHPDETEEPAMEIDDNEHDEHQFENKFKSNQVEDEEDASDGETEACREEQEQMSISNIQQELEDGQEHDVSVVHNNCMLLHP